MCPLYMDILSPKQLEFLHSATAKWNIAHGPVRSGKTVGSLYAFMIACALCPDSQIWMIGHTSSTIYDNAIRLLLESDQFVTFRPFCTWYEGKRELKFRDKTIKTLGAKDGGAIGAIQGKTMSITYCDEITLYPESVLHMIDTRLSNPHSIGFGTCNPSHPQHKVKEWIDKAGNGDPNYYALQFMLDDNPFLDESYKARIRGSLSGLFYKRNYLGLWCLAEGAVFDFFERSVHTCSAPPRTAEYFVAGIDYGTTNNFSCVVIGVNTGRSNQSGPMRWVEAEYVWDSKARGRQKTNAEYADDVANFLEPYGVRSVYVDPSAAAFKVDLRRRHLPVLDADNDVVNGINYITSEMARGSLFVMDECKHLIGEIESYTWDSKKAERGLDLPMKRNDHSIDAMRYAVYSHKVPVYVPYKSSTDNADYLANRFNSTGSTNKRSIFI